MKTVINNEEIASRLREFGLKKFGKIKDFAEALEMHPSSLQSSYLSGRNAPGSPMLAKLINLGCDIHWLLLGVKRDDSDDLLKLKEENNFYKNQLLEIKESIKIKS